MQLNFILLKKINQLSAIYVENLDKKNKTKLCILGDLNSQNKIMLIGDSQKETLELSINNFAIENKIKVYNINHCENFDDILTNPFCKNAIK